MIKSQLESRVKFLSETLNQSLANHNALVGRLEEAKMTLQSLEQMEAVENGLVASEDE